MPFTTQLIQTFMGRLEHHRESILSTMMEIYAYTFYNRNVIIYNSYNNILNGMLLQKSTKDTVCSVSTSRLRVFITMTTR